MSTYTPKQYKKPSIKDIDWYEQLEYNIDRWDSHKHDGIDSELLSPYVLNKIISDILAANWSAVSGQPGTFKQTIAVPSGYSVDKMQVKFFVSGGSEDGHEVFLSIRKTSGTTYDVFINDNSVSLKAVYG